MAYKAKGGVSPLKQDNYWYKVDGKKTDRAGYIAAYNKGIHDPSSENFTDGLGLQTNHPDVHGRKAKQNKSKETPKNSKAKPENTPFQLRSGNSPLHWGWKDTLDAAQTGLTAAGMVPGIGNVADLVNVGVSGARAGYAKYKGDTKGVKEHSKNAAINAAAMVPGAGLAVGGAKLAAKASKGVKVANAVKAVKAAKGVVKAGKVIKKANTVAKDVKKVVKKTKNNPKQIHAVNLKTKSAKKIA